MRVRIRNIFVFRERRLDIKDGHPILAITMARISEIPTSLEDIA